VLRQQARGGGRTLNLISGEADIGKLEEVCKGGTEGGEYLATKELKKGEKKPPKRREKR